MPQNQQNEEITGEKLFEEANRNTVNRMYFFLKVVNIMGAVHTESLKDVYDRLHQLAGLAGVDLTKPPETVNYQEQFRHLALKTMEESGLIHQTSSGYQIDEYRKQEYYDRMYELRYNKEISKSARDLAKLCKALDESAIVSFLIGKTEAEKSFLQAAGEDVKDFTDIKDRLIDKLFTPAIIMYDAYLEVDREIRGKDVPEISRDMISESMKAKTEHTNPAGLVSFMNGLHAFAGYLIVMSRKDFIFQAEERIRQHKGILGFLTKQIPPLEQAAKAALAGIDGFQKQIYEEKFAGKNKMNDIETAILEYNKRNYNSIDRGTNFVQCISQMNVFRCGISEHIPGWCRALHMTKLDTAYALIQLMRRMEPTVDGVQLSKKQVRDMEAVKRQFDHVRDEKRIDRMLKDLETQFINTHKELVRQVNEMRKEGQLPPLDYQTHFNPMFNNPDIPAEPFRYEEMDCKTWESGTTDVEKIFKEKAGIIIHFKDTLVGLFRGELKGITALTDWHGFAKDMIPFHTFRSQERNSSKEICKDCFVDCAHRTMANELVSGEKNADRSAALSQFVLKFLNMDYVVKKDYMEKSYSFTDPETKENFVITKNTFVARESLPIPVQNFVTNIKDSMGKDILESAGISSEDKSDMLYAVRKAEQIPNGKYMHDSYLEKAKTMDGMLAELRKIDPWDILDPVKKQEVAETLKAEWNIKTPEVGEQDQFFDRIKTARELAKTDPQLAACRMIDESFMRDGDMIKGQCCGTEFTIEADGNVAIEGRLTDQRAMEVLQELYEIADSFSRDDGKGLDDPGIEH